MKKIILGLLMVFTISSFAQMATKQMQTAQNNTLIAIYNKLDTLNVSQKFTVVTFSGTIAQISAFTTGGLITSTANPKYMTQYSVALANGCYELVGANFASDYNMSNQCYVFSDTLSATNTVTNSLVGFTSFINDFNKYCGALYTAQTNRLNTSVILYDYVFSPYGTTTVRQNIFMKITNNKFYLLFTCVANFNSIANQKYIVKFYLRRLS